MHGETRIGYVVKRYPRLSETFIVREIIGAEETGADVSIFALAFPEEGTFHADVAHVRGRVTYLPRPEKGSTGLAAIGGLRTLSTPTDDALAAVYEFLDLLPASARHATLINGISLALEADDRQLHHLHAHFMSAAAHVAYVAHVLTRIPFTVTAHAKDIFSQSVDNEVFRVIAEAAQTIVTVSEHNQRYIARELLHDSAARVDVVYNGIVLEQEDDHPVREAGLIVSAGRLVEKKGLPVLLHAVAALRRRDVPVRLVIIGDGEEREGLEALTGFLGLDDVVSFLGAQPNHVVATWMRRAQIFVAPFVIAADGNRDALPTVLVEALAAGTPVVASDVGGVSEIVEHGQEGLVTEPGDVLSFAAAVDRLLDDDDLWAAMSAAGPVKAAERFDRRRTIPELLAAMGIVEPARLTAVSMP